MQHAALHPSCLWSTPFMRSKLLGNIAHYSIACAATNYAALDGRGGSAEEVALRREWARHEAVMTAIAEPNSQESLIAARASERITAICRELGLDDSVIELAHQARLFALLQPTSWKANL